MHIHIHIHIHIHMHTHTPTVRSGRPLPHPLAHFPTLSPTSPPSRPRPHPLALVVTHHTRYASPTTHHASPITRRASLGARHASRITHRSPRITHHSPLATHHASLAARHASLITRHSPPTSRPSPLITALITPLITALITPLVTPPTGGLLPHPLAPGGILHEAIASSQVVQPAGRRRFRFRPQSRMVRRLRLARAGAARSFVVATSRPHPACRRRTRALPSSPLQPCRVASGAGYRHRLAHLLASLLREHAGRRGGEMRRDLGRSGELDDAGREGPVRSSPVQPRLVRGHGHGQARRGRVRTSRVRTSRVRTSQIRSVRSRARRR